MKRLTDRISINQSRDPQWKKWAVILDCRGTEWFDTEAEALAYARGLDIGMINRERATAAKCRK